MTRNVQPLPRRDILAEQRRREAQLAARKQALTEARQSIADDMDMYGDDQDWELARMPVVTRRYDLKPSYEE